MKENREKNEIISCEKNWFENFIIIKYNRKRRKSARDCYY